MTTKKLLLGAALVAVLITMGAPASAQPKSTGIQKREFIGGAVGATDTDVALLIKRIDETAGYVTVSAAGDILLEEGDTSTADTHIECDASIAASGSRNGTLDVSVAACDTLQEVCDIINSQGANEWACVILDGLGTDTPGPSGTGYILAATDADAKITGGYNVKWDTTAALTVTIAMVPQRLRKIEAYYTLNNDKTKTFHTNPHLSNPGIPYFITAHETVTTTGAATFRLYSVLPSTTSGTYTYSTSQGTETITTRYQEAGGATTVLKNFTFAERGGGVVMGDRGEKLVARTTATTDLTAAVMAAVGELRPE